MSKPCNGQCGSEDSVVDDKFQGRATAETGSQLSTYKIPKMDCPSEERMIRMALTGVENIQSLSFDLSGRTLEIIHHGETGPITSKLENLGLGASLQRTEDASAESVRAAESSKANESEESGTLWILLAINGLMFLVEMTMGLIAQSAGLIADSLDMPMPPSTVSHFTPLGTASKCRSERPMWQASSSLSLPLGYWLKLADVFCSAVILSR